MGPHGIGKIYGQEKNITTYNLARMNMLLHGVKDTEFEIYHGDTLTNDWDILRELNPAKKPVFDAIVFAGFTRGCASAFFLLGHTRARLGNTGKMPMMNTWQGHLAHD